MALTVDSWRYTGESWKRIKYGCRVVASDEGNGASRRCLSAWLHGWSHQAYVSVHGYITGHAPPRICLLASIASWSHATTVNFILVFFGFRVGVLSSGIVHAILCASLPLPSRSFFILACRISHLLLNAGLNPSPFLPCAYLRPQCLGSIIWYNTNKYIFEVLFFFFSFVPCAYIYIRPSMF